MKGNRDKDDNGGWVKVQGKGGRGGVGGEVLGYLWKGRRLRL